MRKSILLILIISIGYSCKKDKAPAPVSNEVAYKAILTGANEVPSNASTGSGEANAIFNTDTKVLKVIVTYNGMSAAVSAWHIHKAAAGVNGSVIFNFGTPQPTGFVYTSPALTPEQEADLTGSLYYVNLHSATYPGGEMRGQLLKN